MIAADQLAALLPAACAWAAQLEAHILAAGLALDPAQRGDATAMGVAHPERVRVLLVAAMPTPDHPALAQALAASQIVTSTTDGLTLRYGILIRTEAWPDRELLAHELVHTAQYERRGGFAAFLRDYLAQVMQAGYWAAPMEQAARSRSRALVRAG